MNIDDESEKLLRLLSGLNPFFEEDLNEGKNLCLAFLQKCLCPDYYGTENKLQGKHLEEYLFDIFLVADEMAKILESKDCIVFGKDITQLIKRFKKLKYMNYYDTDKKDNA